MKKLFMIFSALAVLLAGNGCREEFLPPESQTRTVQVSATVRMPGIAEMSRAADPLNLAMLREFKSVL